MSLQAGDEVAVIETQKGRIVLEFFPDYAPNHVENFKKLAREGFYDGTRFHRVIPGFVIQGGDPHTKDLGKASIWGTGGPDARVRAEFNELLHKRGILSMARSSDPHSAGSQFFVCVADVPSLDRQYTVFGNVVEGMEAVDAIVQTPTTDRNGTVVPEEAIEMQSVTIQTWPLE
ncbi:MAG: peptidylprolyl isomerase [Fimbriimonadaceae bacterium]|nr:peptidylprolyl isomerase [Fimbriimonadaceae bacterium]